MLPRGDESNLRDSHVCIGCDKTTMAGLFEFGGRNGEFAYKLHFMVSLKYCERLAQGRI
jgi:hypothetical protein